MNASQSFSSVSSWSSSTCTSSPSYSSAFLPIKQSSTNLLTPVGICNSATFSSDKNLQGNQNSGRAIKGIKNVQNSPIQTYNNHNRPIMYNDCNNKINTLHQVRASMPVNSTCFGANYSRKVFVGGLPPDINEGEIMNQFHYYGNLNVDWPHKSDSKSAFPPKGFAFLIFDNEQSVRDLISNCKIDEKNKFYIDISSPSIKNKPVQIRPWCLSDSEFVFDQNNVIDSRRTVFIGGIPRPLKAGELALIMNKLFGGVCYASIDTDNELKYPKGAGRVSFSNQESYVSAISARFIQLQNGEIDKRAEVKPYVLDDQICDLCMSSSNRKSAPFFCANISCLQYYCEPCWSSFHSRSGREFHKPLIKEGADRPRTIPFRWC